MAPTAAVPPAASQNAVVTTPEQLAATAGNPDITTIVLRGALVDVPSYRLAPGQALIGEGPGASISFAGGSDGLQLSADNEVRGVALHASPARRAIFNDCQVESLGRLRIADVTATGQVQILVRDAVRGGHVEVDGLDVIAADTRAQSDRPQGYGVHVLQGAFTLWNMQADKTCIVSARLAGLAAGRAGAPVLGSGVFVSGGGDDAGRLIAPLIETAAIWSDGRIAAGTPDQITGGVFTVYGAHVDVVRNRGPVTTYGVNDMVLDNWGAVDRWIVEDKITSYGPSGIGLQNSQTIGRLVVHRGIETFGATGESLVKGVVMTLSAIGLSIKPGGSAREIEIEGGLMTRGKGIPTLELNGSVGTLRIAGGVAAVGGGFETI